MANHDKDCVKGIGGDRGKGRMQWSKGLRANAGEESADRERGGDCHCPRQIPSLRADEQSDRSDQPTPPDGHPLEPRHDCFALTQPMLPS
jgi:hypothetical protein